MADGLMDQALTRKLLAVASEAGLDLESALRGSDEELRPTEIAQPALYLVEVVLASLFPKGVELLGVAGHSIGEYAAVATAGALDPLEGMDLVIARGRAMAAMTSGTMAALIGADLATAERVCSEATEEGEVVVVANLNAPGQVVISGTDTGVARAAEHAKEAGVKRVVPLNVSGAFHSPLMAEAADQFAARLETVALKDTKVPVVSNVDGMANLRAEEIRTRLKRQLVSPVRWTDCVARLAGLGVDYLVEVGPGSVLTGLAKRIAPGVDSLSVSTPEEMAALPELVGAKVR